MAGKLEIADYASRVSSAFGFRSEASSVRPQSPALSDFSGNLDDFEDTEVMNTADDFMDVEADDSAEADDFDSDA